MKIKDMVGLGLAIIMLCAFIWLVYSFSFSPTAKAQRELNKGFEVCIEKIGEDYCENRSKDYGWIVYYDFKSLEEYYYLNKPSQIVCRDKRECCDMERYYILEEEIDYCLEQLNL